MAVPLIGVLLGVWVLYLVCTGNAMTFRGGVAVTSAHLPLHSTTQAP